MYVPREEIFQCLCRSRSLEMDYKIYDCENSMIKSYGVIILGYYILKIELIKWRNFNSL